MSRTDTVPAMGANVGGGMNEGYRIISYLVAGLIFYGGLGWLADAWLNTRFLLPIGIVVGMALSLYIVIKRHQEILLDEEQKERQ